MTKPPLTVDQIVNTPWPDFSWPLEIARGWVRSDVPELREQAPELLRRLRRERFPHALQLGQEEVLALMECRRPDEAERVLQEIEPEFGSPDEEVLCRWGRLYKDRGDEHLLADSRDEAARRLTVECYRLAAARYQQAYAVQQGHYPGINWATLLLVLGSLVEAERELLLRKCGEVVDELLMRRRLWAQAQPDDNIWHLATEAEANLLQEDWTAAAERYRQAQRQSNVRPFHCQSMKKQARRILSAYARIGRTDLGPFNDLETVIPDVCSTESPPDDDTSTVPDDQMPQ